MINNTNLLNNDNKKPKKTSEAKLKANKKYDNSHYKTLAAKVKISELSQINEYASRNNMSISKMIYNCIKYCMDNNINLDK